MPEAIKGGVRARVAVLFLDTDTETSATVPSIHKVWGEDADSREQAALLTTVREELAPYVVQAIAVAAREDDWEAILG